MVDGLRPANSGVELRPATADDRAFILALYRAVREDELALTSWTAGEKAAFVEAQFRAREVQYRETYPDGRFLIVTRGAQPIGRLSVARLADEMRVVDIALVPAERGHGIGAALLAGVIAEADGAALPVRLHVETWNRARRLYERLGFRSVEVRGIHELMERPTTRSAARGVGQLKTAS